MYHKEKDLYLDPGEKYNDSRHIVELDLKVSQSLKAGVSGMVLQQTSAKVFNHGCSGYVHDYSDKAQLRNEQRGNRTQSMLSTSLLKNHFSFPSWDFDTHHDNENIQAVPQTLEVMQAVDADLQHFLHDVVQDEQAECHFTQTHKVVPAGHVANQTHRLELPGGHHPTSGRELYQQPAWTSN